MSETTPDPRPKPRLRLPVSRQRMVEFAVVVLGVLVALGLENLIQEVRFRADARDLERAFVTDISGAVALSLERQAVTPCLIQRLRVLSQHADAATGSFVAVEAIPGDPGYATPQLYRAPTRVWVTASFDRALGSEAFKRIPAARVDEYAVLFALIRGHEELNDAEYLASMGLSPLAYRQPNMTAEVRADALRHISNLDRHQQKLALGSGQVIEAAMTLSLVGKEIRHLMIEDRGQLEEFRSRLRAVYGECTDFAAMDGLLALEAS